MAVEAAGGRFPAGVLAAPLAAGRTGPQAAGAAAGGREAEAGGGPGFAAVLARSLERVEQEQVAAQEAARRLATGEVADLSEVMIASERAFLSLSTVVQVRNKVLEAYQELMRMQV